ncbi:MAG: hypothetical protein M3O70_20670, partial [Actinomycetota bacterium]|nr:hypothetical protein [Actinomycetota bacterium]
MRAVIFLPIAVGLVAVAPGALLVAAIRGRNMPGLADVAVWPLLSLGVVYLLAEVSLITPVRVSPLSFLMLMGLLLVAAAVRGSPSRGARSPRGPLRPALPVLTAVAVVLGIGVWAWGLQGVPDIPPNHDGAHHGFMTARIVDSGTIDPAEVLVSDPRTEHQTAAFYPLAMHAMAALAHRLSGASVAQSLVAVTVLYAGFALPVGIAALTRRLGGDPVHAGSAAVLATALFLFPYKPIAWGGMPLIVSLSVVPATLVLALQLMRQPADRSLAVLSSVGLVAHVGTHTSQLPAVALLAGILIVGAAVEGRISWRDLRRVVASAAIAVAVSMVLLLPVVGDVLSGTSERVGLVETPPQSLELALGNLLTLQLAFEHHRQVLLAAVAVLGCAILLVQRRMLTWLVAGTAVLGLYVLTAAYRGPVYDATTFPWYGQAERVAYYAAFFLPVLGGAVAATSVRILRSDRHRMVHKVAGVVATIAVVVAVAHGSLIAPWMVRGSFEYHLPIGDDELQAFAFLGHHVPPEHVVVTNENMDVSLWMYPFERVEPVFLLPPSPAFGSGTWGERVELAKHIGSLGADPMIDRLARKYRISHVYFDGTPLPTAPLHFGLEDLRASPRLVEAFASGP